MRWNSSRNWFFFSPDGVDGGGGESSIPSSFELSGRDSVGNYSPGGDEPLQDNEILDMLRGGSSTINPPTEMPPAEAAPVSQPQPQPAPEHAPPAGVTPANTAPAQAPTAAPSPATPDPALLAAQVEHFKTLIARHGIDPVTGQMAQPPAPAAPQPAPASPHGASAEDPFAYDIQVPESLVQGFMSAKPEEVKAAVAAMANSLASMVQRNTTTQLAQAIPHLMQRHLQQHETMREVHNDFYGTYKDLNVPALKGVVQSCLMAMVQEGLVPNYQWSGAVKQELARRVYGTFGRQPPSVAQPSGIPGAQPQPLAAPGTRGNSPQPQDYQQQQMLDLFSDFMGASH